MRTFAGSLASNGQRLDIGDLVLDNTAPRIVSIDPPDRSAGVTLQPAVSVTFSEPMRTSTFQGSTGGNVILLDGCDIRTAAVTDVLERQPHGHHSAGAGVAQQRGVHAHDPRRPGRAERRGRRSAAPRRFREHLHDRRQHRAGDRRCESGQRRKAGPARRQHPRGLLRTRRHWDPDAAERCRRGDHGPDGLHCRQHGARIRAAGVPPGQYDLHGDAHGGHGYRRQRACQAAERHVLDTRHDRANDHGAPDRRHRASRRADLCNTQRHRQRHPPCRVH